MLYWLFTNGRDILSSLITPLLCLSLFMPLIVSAIMGAGIQRSSEIQGRFGLEAHSEVADNCRCAVGCDNHLSHVLE